MNKSTGKFLLFRFGQSLRRHYFGSLQHPDLSIDGSKRALENEIRFMRNRNFAAKLVVKEIQNTLVK